MDKQLNGFNSRQDYLDDLADEYFISRGKRYDYLVFDKISQVIICRSNNYYTLHKKYFKEQRYDIWISNNS